MSVYNIFILLSLILVIVQSSVTWEQFGLNYDSTTTNMVVTFAAWTDVTSVECLYGSSATSLTSSATAPGSTYTMGSYTSPMLFKATLNGLKEGNKVYYYKCGSKSLGYSDVQSFKTHPGIGINDVTFHICGDVGQTSNSVNTFNEIIEYQNSIKGFTGGIISMGDLSYANGDEPLWDSFGQLREVASKNIPMMTTLGNHEWFDSYDYSFTAYKARFDNPLVNGKKELYYSYNAGLAHIVMVAGYCQEMKSTYTQPCLATGSPQMNWLQNDLKNVDRAITPWVIVVFHEPYVNSNTAHSIQTEGLPMQAAIENTLYDNKVDLVFSGHVHAYERSCQVYNYTCVSAAPYYITIGDGGNAEGLATTWVNPQPSWSVFRQASYGFGELQIVNNTYLSWEWHQNKDLVPTIADSFVINKANKDTNNNNNLMNKDITHSTGSGITGIPMFVNNERGRIASKFNEQAIINSKLSTSYGRYQQENK